MLLRISVAGVEGHGGAWRARAGGCLRRARRWNSPPVVQRCKTPADSPPNSPEQPAGSRTTSRSWRPRRGRPLRPRSTPENRPPPNRASTPAPARWKGAEREPNPGPLDVLSTIKSLSLSRRGLFPVNRLGALKNGFHYEITKVFVFRKTFSNYSPKIETFPLGNFEKFLFK